MTHYTATITSDGTVMPGHIELRSIEVRKQLGRISEATLVLLDGSVATGAFQLSDTDFFAPARTIEILLREGDQVDKQVFAGQVIRHTVEAGDDRSELRVELKDAAQALTRGRRSALYADQSDDQVIRALIERADLRVGTIDRTRVTHKQLVQHQASDWDFLLARADVNGLLVSVDDGVVSAVSMATVLTSAATFKYGFDAIHEFELELDSGDQWGEMTGTAWDPTNLAATDPISATQLRVAGDRFDLDAVTGKLGAASYELLTPTALAPGELKAWADARLARSRLSLLRGRLVVAGDPDLRPASGITLEGVGARFNGDLLVSGVIHRVDADGWWTELQLGLSPEWFARRPDIADAPAGGLLPPAMQLQLGIVEDLTEDPDGEYRVRIRLPGLEPLWARIARPDAGDGRGHCFWPEPRDEVVVGFIGGDPRQAIVLGALFGAAHPPPDSEAPADPNQRRALVSKSGVKVAFDDEKAALTLATPRGNRIVIDDDAGAITLTDQHGNTITMDSSGITLKSAGDLGIEAAGKVVIKGTAVDIQ